MSRFQTSSEYGFSLIELMAVITVMSILAVAAYPSFISRNEAALSTAAETLAADIRSTRLGSITAGSSRSIVLTAGSGAYIYDSAAGSGETRDLSVIRGGITIAADALVTFNSLGENGGQETAITVTMDGDWRTVTVFPYTGKISIQ